MVRQSRPRKVGEEKRKTAEHKVQERLVGEWAATWLHASEWARRLGLAANALTGTSTPVDEGVRWVRMVFA